MTVTGQGISRALRQVGMAAVRCNSNRQYVSGNGFYVRRRRSKSGGTIGWSVLWHPTREELALTMIDPRYSRCVLIKDTLRAKGYDARLLTTKAGKPFVFVPA